MVFGFKRQNILGCGLVGFSGKGEFNLIAIKTLLLYNSVVRKSTDATGLFTPSMGIVKDVKTPNEFFKIEKYSSLIEERNEVLMGHVRAATVGNKDNKEEAHPWDFGTIVMMHNGTLKNHEKLAEKYGLEKDSWKVDSQVLGAAIKKNFDNKEPFKVLSEYDGAAAIVVYHKERDSLFIYRDDKRTLAYGY